MSSHKYIEINMYNIHAHIEKKKQRKILERKETKREKDTYIEELILFIQIPLTIHTYI